MNNLEKFIKSKREEFDTKEPREKLWTQIESDLNGGKSDYGWLWKAAVVALLAVCGYLVWERSVHQTIDSAVASELQFDTEFIETELYYTQLISQKTLVLEAYDIDDQKVKEAFKNDLLSLDSSYYDLKQEFIDTNNEAVLDALISNLEVRMELLNQQLMILKTIENDNHNETTETKYL